MMRNQKHHEQEECARFLREDYENKEQEKIKQLEEEEQRKNRVQELQRERRRLKEEKEKKEKEASRPKAPTSYGASKPKVSGAKRALPDYYGASSSSKPSGVATRTRGKKPTESTPKPSTKPTDSYKSKLRHRRVPGTKEEEKESASKPSYSSKPSKPTNKYNSSSRDAEMADAHVMEEIPAELLNQIYSEDLDQTELEKIQSQEYEAVNKPSHSENPVGERLIGGPMDMEYRNPPRVEPRARHVSPPPIEHSNPDVDMPMPARPEENENEMIQKAIAESLRQNNPRQHPMSKHYYIIHQFMQIISFGMEQKG